MANKLWIFLLLCTFQAHSQRVLLFANGYLGPDKDKIPRNNGVTMKPQGYWYSYDDTLVKRFHPTAAIYVSGHHPMSTSMHRTKARFGASWLISKFLWVRSKKGFGLNTRPNPEGFNIRFENGKICGQNLLKLLNDSLPNIGRNDTLDIVCHSMGYAYVLGILTQVDTLFHLGKILILSPESPQQMGYDWNRFEEVWQYGSNLGEKKADLIVFQDGIAPQAPVKNLEQLLPGKGGRVFVPKSAARGTVSSHHLSKFDWFFDIRPGDYGYFTR
jgi:hypothetical protein